MSTPANTLGLALASPVGIPANVTVRESIPDYGHHMTWADFVDCVASGSFIDYDGSGVLATATQCTDIDISPSDVELDDNDQADPPYTWVTHIVWFNR